MNEITVSLFFRWVAQLVESNATTLAFVNAAGNKSLSMYIHFPKSSGEPHQSDKFACDFLMSFRLNYVWLRVFLFLISLYCSIYWNKLTVLLSIQIFLFSRTKSATLAIPYLNFARKVLPGSTPLSIGYTSPIFSAEWDILTRRP